MEFKISVIIPTLNRAELLEGALNSVIGQTYPPDEVIVIDDGSTDATGEMIRSKFPGVIYRWQENHGISHARNQGIKKTNNEWLAFLDSDDEWLPQKLEKQVGALCKEIEPEKNSKLAISNWQLTIANLICHTNEIWIRRGKRVNPMNKHAKYGGYIFRKCLPLCIISPSSVLMHRSIFETIGMFDETLPACEDYDLWLRICSRYPVVYLDEPLIIKYGGHKDQLSRKFWGMDRFRIQALENIIQSGKLNSEDLKAAIEMLLKKADIYIQGAEKRKKGDEVEVYRQKKLYYQKMFIKL